MMMMVPQQFLKVLLGRLVVNLLGMASEKWAGKTGNNTKQ